MFRRHLRETRSSGKTGRLLNQIIGLKTSRNLSCTPEGRSRASSVQTSSTLRREREREADQGVELLTQLVGGGDNVSGNARVQISVHDAEGVQLGHVVPTDLQGVTTAQSPPRKGETEEEEQRG